MLMSFSRYTNQNRGLILLGVLLFLSACQSGAPVVSTTVDDSGIINDAGYKPAILAQTDSDEEGVDTTKVGTSAKVVPAVFDDTKTHSKSTRTLFNKSIDALSEGRDKDAVMFLQVLTENAPDLSSPWANLGLAYLNLGEIDKATVALEQAISKNPTNCVALNQLGILARKAGDFAKAESRYLACIQHIPEFREAHLNIAILYELYLGKYAAALSEYRAYQALLDEPDRRIAGWVMDLERRELSMVAIRVQ